MGQKGLFSLSVLLFSALFAPKAHAINAPWYIFASEVKAALGADACVTVDDLAGSGSEFQLNIHVCSQLKANALAVLLVPGKSFGAIQVDVRVFGPDNTLIPHDALPTDLEKVTDLINTGLAGNCLFIEVAAGNAIHPFFIDFAKTVVQFYGDNLADAHSNINLVAADAFSDFLVSALPTSTSETYVSSCGGK